NQDSIGKIHLNPDWKIFEVSGYNFARWKIASVPFSGIRIPLPVPQPIDLVTIVKA
ncbi:MAG: hypothetical protein JO313_04405, partial [Verrucomicrobia bacterium]|nr:hypothetical protein [Verrucomicrobiota bacterium]